MITKNYWLLFLMMGIITFSFAQKDSLSKPRTGCLAGNCADGSGVYLFENGARYEGEFHNNMMQGKGKCVFSSGDYWDGEWQAGKMDGFGTYLYKDYRRYDGFMKADMREGYGIFFNADGSIFHNGLCHLNDKVEKKN